MQSPEFLPLFALCILLISALFYTIAHSFASSIVVYRSKIIFPLGFAYFSTPSSKASTATSGNKAFRLAKIVHVGYQDRKEHDEKQVVKVMAYRNVSPLENEIAYLNALSALNETFFTLNPLKIDSIPNYSTFQTVYSTLLEDTAAHFDIDKNSNNGGDTCIDEGTPKLSHLPNLKDRQTILSLALMSFNAYGIPSDTEDWLPINDPKWNHNVSFGWEGNGLRGHVFSSEDEKQIIVAFKGTSPYWLGIGGPTGERDRLNDNRMFSCCCAKVNFWTPTPISTFCDCYKGQDPKTNQHKCSKSCVLENADFDTSYYNAALSIYTYIRRIYPASTQIWFTGHSLGGSIASLMGLTTNQAAVTFESPGDLMYAQQLGLNVESGGNYPVFHIGNSADPIYMGTCSKVRSACYITGYAIETKCHAGYQCTYKLEGKEEDIRYHKIGQLIQNVIQSPSLPLPECKLGPRDCIDCNWWEWLE